MLYPLYIYTPKMVFKPSVLPANCLKLKVTQRYLKKVSMPHIDGNRKKPDYHNGKTGTKVIFTGN
jgi:hypothetical protein